MRIGIDCRLWNETGVGRYIRSIVSELAEIDTKNEYVLFFLSKDIDSCLLPKNFKKVKADVRWHTVYEQLLMPFLFLKARLDLLHVPYFNVPVLYPKKFVVTVHDLTLLRVKTGRATTRLYPIYLIWRLAFKLVLWFSIKRAAIIFTVSEYVKADIVHTYNVRSEKVLVTPNAVSDHFYPRSGDEVDAVLKKYQITRPYLFYIGNAHPHKNLERLIRAFDLVYKSHPDLTLVLGGRKDFFYSRLESEVETTALSEKIRFTGFVSDEDLPALYSASEALVNPSLYEGFGIQVLEAFACNTKVVCSNTTSLPEVGVDAAYYFDPRNVADIAQVISKALSDSSSGNIQRGEEIQKRYSWAVSAQKTFETYRNISL